MGELEIWTEWARGPLFRAALAFMILGLLRHAALTIWELAGIMYRAGDKAFPWRRAFSATLKWLFPVGQIKNRVLYSLTTLGFHAAVIIVPVFLAGHVALWERGTGLCWPTIPNGVADVLTIMAVLAAALLVAERAAARDSRALSRFQDYALPLLVAAPFATGFLVMHPALNPFGHEATILVHVLSADILFILIPLTKLSHMILLPGTQIISELSWHFPPDAGRKVGVDLGKEKQPI
ncbi:MAG: hypothetical protein ABII00_03760 [Elusimicrobiota bacterium]